MAQDELDAEETLLGRAGLLVGLVEAEADLCIARGTAGGWVEIKGQCEALREALKPDTTCEFRWHFYWIELEVWRFILANTILPHRRDELLEVFREQATLRSPEDPRAWGDALWMVDSRLVEDTEFDEKPFIRVELRFLEALKAFRDRPTSIGLRSCLGIVSELVRLIKEVAGHYPCGVDTYWAVVMVAGALAERLPLLRRWGIAMYSRQVLYVVWGDGEMPRSTLDRVPHALQCQLKKGELVSASHRVMDPYRSDESADFGPWFVDGFEEWLSEYQGWSVGQLLGVERS